MLAQPEEEYEDFPEKLEFLFEKHRYKVAEGGRVGTKSWGFSRALLLKGVELPLRILCAREIQRSIKESVHQLLSDQIIEMGMEGNYEVLANEIRGENGAKFSFTGLSGQTTASLKSYEGYDICWVEEAQTVIRRSWDILIPTIRKAGSEIWISLNPELDSDETYKRFVLDPPKSAKVVHIGWQDNAWLTDEANEERLEFLRQVEKGVREQDDYDNIWEGKCKTVVEGAIYAKELVELKKSGRLCRVPYDPLLKVHTIWDLGWNDAMSILLVQKMGSEIRIIGYIEDTHRTVPDYVKTQEPGRDDLETLKYNWGTDYVPAVDGFSKSALSKHSAYDYLVMSGRDADPQGAQDIGIEKGIAAARLLLPRVVIDEENAGLLFNRLSKYKRNIPTTTNEPGKPVHDENSHGSDGFRYLAVVADKLTNEKKEMTDPYKNWADYG